MVDNHGMISLENFFPFVSFILIFSRTKINDLKMPIMDDEFFFKHEKVKSSYSEDSRVISRELVLLQGSGKLNIQNNSLDIFN